MSKQLTIEFHELPAAEGTIDLAIRFDTKTGRYNFMIEENGLPTTLPAHVFTGIVHSVLNDAVRGCIDGFRSD